MNYLVLGSNGFAQLGSHAYFEKQRVEMRIILDFFHKNFPIPEGFKSSAYFSIKTFPHDFGSYQEVVLWYDDRYLTELEESEIEADNQLFDQFWDWYNSAERADLESDEMTDKIRDAYLETIDVEKGEHLSYSKAS